MNYYYYTYILREEKKCFVLYRSSYNT